MQQAAVVVELFPNPFEERATFRISSHRQFKKIELQLFDALGRMSMQTAVQGSQELHLLRGDLQTGLYFYRMIGDGELLQSGKIIVK